MSVILMGMKMPENCAICKLRKPLKLHPDDCLVCGCPLKSVDGLIERIKSHKASVDLAISEDDSKIDGMKEAYQDCVDIIKEYFGLEDE